MLKRAELKGKGNLFSLGVQGLKDWRSWIQVAGKRFIKRVIGLMLKGIHVGRDLLVARCFVADSWSLGNI